ncbi:MAG: hypothetical protein JXA04_10690 [Gammaproteobacteria bacterium]|nr:hypothetical protein [Gammaproteobacteria bacterium]
MNSEYAESKTFRLSENLSVAFTVGPAGFCCEWTQDIPESLSAEELRLYKVARNEMLRRLAQRMNGNVICVDC